MKARTKTELRRIMQAALNHTYGFAPKLTDIILQEASSDGTYIFARVGCHYYRFDSATDPYGAVIICNNIITKVSERGTTI